MDENKNENQKKNIKLTVDAEKHEFVIDQSTDEDKINYVINPIQLHRVIDKAQLIDLKDMIIDFLEKTKMMTNTTTTEEKGKKSITIDLDEDEDWLTIWIPQDDGTDQIIKIELDRVDSGSLKAMHWAAKERLGY